MLIDWIIFPLAVLVLLAGCGLLAREALGRWVPGAVVPALGLVTVVVVGQMTAWADATAGLTTPLAAAMAVAGFALAWRRGGLGRPDPWACAAAAGVFAVYAAPIVLSGEATFAGFIKLDDTATWMALTDRIMDHGRSLSGLAPSTYEATLAFNLGKGYPIGAFLPLGVGRGLVGQDVAWVIQPYMAVLGSLLALALWEVPRGLVASSRLRAGVAFLAAQPALLYGYYLWGGIKEMTAALLIASAAVLAGVVIASPARRAPVAALALVAAAAVGVLSGGGAVWLLPPLLAALWAAVRALGGLLAARRAAVFAAALALLSLPVIVPGGLLPPTSSPLDSATALGNLINPLHLEQVAGIWPVGDFRLVPAHELTPDLLIAVAVGGAGIGVALAWGRRSWATLVYVGGVLLAGIAIYTVGSPWVGGKALATASPAIPFAALLGAAALWSMGVRALGAALALVMAVGLLWSNALAYRSVNLAPRGQLDDLQAIGNDLAGKGPTLMTEYEPYGARHFLRDGDPEGASELRRRLDPLLDGRPLRKGESADTDRFQLDGLLAYRTLVLRRSPAQSRPPSPYRLVYRGQSYEEWRRGPEFPSQVVDHLGLGGPVDPAGVPRCSDVARLATEAGPQGTLAAVPRKPIEPVATAAMRHPRTWESRAYASALVPRTPGTISTTLNVPSAGAYEVWLGGSVRPQVDLSVDGRPAGSVRGILNNAGEFVRLGEAELQPGRHGIAVTFHGSDLHPGSGGAPEPIGPLVLSPEDPATTRIHSVPASKAATLCGHRWDWIEALSGAAPGD